MKISISRRDIVVAGCLAGIAAWTVPSQAAPVSFKVTKRVMIKMIDTKIPAAFVPQLRRCRQFCL
jgi:hypothetical protein